ncbi:hypothetical protein DCAR_0522097 [Daucus carota subsp. sativus]|uniref:Peptidase A1 domain-containing protein n=1 Tax=Daucus carota subsp. sativus TaxID=79200 RepID=A0AAF1B2Z7_DAUCS|nr:PREDICTED: aspartyl protease AED3 [Daucus carota subsp. sativus]WOH02708.1 hypothetical protein DCAR_0522097 [Daucus carota subsp. sativus]
MGSTSLLNLICTLLLTTLLVKSSHGSDACSASNSKSDISIVHIYGKCSPFNAPNPSASWATTVLDMASRDKQRLAYLSSLAGLKPTKVPVASGQNVLNMGNYVARVKVGTPGQLMFMVLDTSNDAAWIPCTGCTQCTSTIFSPNASSTYAPAQCSMPECAQVRGLSCPASGTGTCLFNQSYGGDSTFSATLSYDSISLGNDVIPNYAFGCINEISGKSVPPQGLLGLGRGPISLLSQTGALYSGIFSYCLPSFKSYYFSGSLKLGPLGQPKNIKTTPLLKNPHRPSLYYVNLTGITVGRVSVPIAPELLAFNPSTGAGTIIDSGTVITRFAQPIYNAVRDEFRNQTKGPFTSLGAFDTCFAATNEDVAPAITLRFTGMDLLLPMENSLIHSSAGTTACLAMAASPNNINAAVNVIANLQQQNLRILFDVANSRLGIARELCN